MTREELLERVSSSAIQGYQYCDIAFAAAIRAVVELHQPFATFVDGSDKSIEICIQCREGNFIADYPCNTIQIIEKELR